MLSINLLAINYLGLSNDNIWLVLQLIFVNNLIDKCINVCCIPIVYS